MAEQRQQEASVGSDVIYDYVCQLCSRANKTLEAAGFCVHCSEFLCDECFRYHLKHPVTRHHELLDIEDRKKDKSLPGCLDICTEKCAQHKGKIIEYFCGDHDYLGCWVCINLDHRNCQEVQYIPKIAKNTVNGEEFSSLMRKLDMVLLQAKILLETSRNNKLQSQSIFDQALDKVKRVRKDVNEALDKLEREIETEAEQIKIQDSQKMDEHVTSCYSVQKKTEALTESMKGMKEKGHPCNLFVAMKTSKNEMRPLVQILEDISNDVSVSDYMFQHSRLLEDFLKHSEVHGKLSMMDGSKTKATKLDEICVKMSSDSKSCNITALVTIGYDSLVAADCYNKEVKLVDTKKSEVISEYGLPYSPWDITSTGEIDEIAVTVPGANEIFIIKVRDDILCKEKQIKTGSKCYGIAYIADRFVVSFITPERLEIIDKQGNILQTIEKDEQGQQLFINVWSVAFSQDTGSIYVPDCDKNTVTRLSLPGQVLGIYEDSELKRARCVSVGKQGALYVCGESSLNVHHISADCQKISILLTESDGLSNPRSLCYDRNTNRLYVGQDGDNVLVYQLS